MTYVKPTASLQPDTSEALCTPCVWPPVSPRTDARLCDEPLCCRRDEENKQGKNDEAQAHANEDEDEEGGEADEDEGEEGGEENPEQDHETMEETGGEAQAVKSPTVMRKPTLEEINEHRRTHLPYRNWCPICIASRGKDLPHKAIDRRGDGVPIIGMDYFFVGDDGAGVIPAIAARNSITKALIGTAVPTKGIEQSDWPAKYVAACIDELGYKRVTIRSDKEPAVTALVHSIRKNCDTEVLEETSPQGDKNTNGHGERAVQSLEGQVRALKMELESRISAEVPARHPIVTWAISHGADIVTRCEVKASGATSYQAVKGRPYRGMNTDFVRTVMYYPVVEEETLDRGGKSECG